MQEIVTCLKQNGGISLIVEAEEGARPIFFSYQELISLKINALDLLEHPRRYVYDPGHHRIVLAR